MSLIHRLGCLLLVWLVAVVSPAAAQERDPEGLWAVRAEGRVLALLELRRDARAPGGWTGALVGPDRLTFHVARLASGIEGPIIRRPILEAVSREDSIELAIQGSARDVEPEIYTFRLVEPDTALLGWTDVPAPLDPLLLARAPAGTEVAADWDPTRTYALAAPVRRSNPEMTALFEADQAARQSDRPIDWSVVAQQDLARRTRTRQLLDAGALQSADDYWHAAFVFQHGGEPGDHLMAHTLALIAAARGRPDATWIAAASLDRYLQNIGQKQIYGTQYLTRPGQPATQEPYDRMLVSDALRQALGVPTQAEQEQRRAEFDAETRAREARRPGDR